MRKLWLLLWHSKCQRNRVVVHLQLEYRQLWLLHRRQRHMVLWQLDSFDRLWPDFANSDSLV